MFLGELPKFFLLSHAAPAKFRQLPWVPRISTVHLPRYLPSWFQFGEEFMIDRMQGIPYLWRTTTLSQSEGHQTLVFILSYSFISVWCSSVNSKNIFSSFIYISLSHILDLYTLTFFSYLSGFFLLAAKCRMLLHWSIFPVFQWSLFLVSAHPKPRIIIFSLGYQVYVRESSNVFLTILPLVYRCSQIILLFDGIPQDKQIIWVGMTQSEKICIDNKVPGVIIEN